MPTSWTKNDKGITLLEFNEILDDKRVTTVHLWFRTLLNSTKEKSPEKMKEEIVKMANELYEKQEIEIGKFKVRLPFPLQGYHLVFFLLFQVCVCLEWQESCGNWKKTNRSLSQADEEMLDKSMMRFYHDFIIERDEHRCQLCGEPVQNETAQVHHIWPRRNSKKEIIGPSTSHNLITLCSKCHSSIHPWLEKQE
jgi:hypothetical protein